MVKDKIEGIILHMLEPILTKITIGLILSFMGYIVVRDTLRFINRKKAKSK